jgi:hypothetical protein
MQRAKVRHGGLDHGRHTLRGGDVRLDEKRLGTSLFQIFIPYHVLLPGRPGFPGFIAVALVAALFALPAAAATGERHPNPRWPLALALLLLVLTSVVVVPDSADELVVLERNNLPPGAWPNLHMLLESALPGLSLGRGPAGVYIAAHMLIAVLAGFGTAAAIRRVPSRMQVALAVTLVSVVCIETMRPAWLGFRPSFGYEAVEIRPAEAVLDSYRALTERMPGGGLLEVPFTVIRMDEVSRGVLLSAYHGRPTSYCYSPYLPAVTEEARALASELPDRAVLVQLRSMGFTGLVVHHDPADFSGGYRRKDFARFAAAEGADLLELIGGDKTLTTYLIRPAEARPGPSKPRVDQTRTH